MTAPVAPQFHLDLPVSWRPENPNLEIVGWLYAGPSGQAVDLRAQVDGRVFFGIYGLDRPDTEKNFNEGLASLRTGFIQRVQIWRGARELKLEFHNGKTWCEFFRTALDTSLLPVSAVRPKRVLRAAAVYQTLQYLYRHFHRVSFRRICREVDHVLADVLAPAMQVTGGTEFLGHIENPGHWVNISYEKFRTTGWTFAIGGEISRLSATTGVLTENRLVYPKDRPDVASHRSDHGNALKSGYYGLVDILPETPSPANLKLFALLPDGSRRLAFARRLYLDRTDEHSGPIPIFRSFLFYKVTVALLRGVLLGRFAFDSWPESRAEIVRLRADLSATLGHGEEKKIPAAIIRRRDQDPYTRWCWHNRLTPRLRAALQQDAEVRGRPLPPAWREWPLPDSHG